MTALSDCIEAADVPEKLREEAKAELERYRAVVEAARGLQRALVIDEEGAMTTRPEEWAAPWVALVAALDSEAGA